jgi:phosphocarrier protein
MSGDAGPVEGLDSEDCPPVPIPPGALARELPIVNRKGLHARASAKFVQTVERFDAAVTVTRCGETVGGRSIMGLLTLGAAQGTMVTVTAAGADAQACLDAIDALLANRFGEGE